MHDGLDGREARHRDRAGRQPGVAVGVVGAVDVEVGAGQRPVKPAQAARDGVGHSRVALQLHAAAQAVEENGSDVRTLLRPGRLLLDEAGERERLLGRRERQARRAPGPGGGEGAVHGSLGARRESGPGRATVVEVGLGEHATFGRHHWVAGQRVAVLQEECHLRGRQPVRDRELVLHGFGKAQDVQDLTQAGLGREVELARVERAVAARGEGGEAQLQGIGDNAVRGQRLRHRLESAARHDNGTGGRQGAGRVEAAPRKQRAAAHEQGEDQESEGRTDQAAHGGDP